MLEKADVDGLGKHLVPLAKIVRIGPLEYPSRKDTPAVDIDWFSVVHRQNGRQLLQTTLGILIKGHLQWQLSDTLHTLKVGKHPLNGVTEHEDHPDRPEVFVNCPGHPRTSKDIPW